MPRYFITSENLNNNYIDKENYHHLKVVNRCKINDIVELQCENITYSVKITDITDSKVIFEVIDQFYFDTEFNFDVTLMQCYPKGDKMEEVIKHATELGVYSIIPVISERTIVRLDDKKRADKVKRLNAISYEASKQSRRNHIPLIENIVDLNKMDFTKYNVKIFAYEKESTNTSNKKFVEIVNNIKENDNVIIAIGPEGGFSTNEADFLINNGFIPVSFGKRILRTETAGLYALSVIGALKE